MVGLKKIYPNAALVFPGSQEKPVRDFLTTFPIETTKIKDIALDSINRLIIVDTKDPERIGDFNKIANKKDVQVFVYDHHLKKDTDVRAAVEIIEEVGATATIVTEILKERNVKLSSLEATIICLGIYEETGSLRFSTTTERDLYACAYLLRRGADLNIVSNYIKPQLSKEGLELLNELLAAPTYNFENHIRIKIATATKDAYVADAAVFAHTIMDMEDIDGVILILNLEGRVFLIGRSRISEFDVRNLMKHFAGDGHPGAASAALKDTAPLNDVKEKIIAILNEIIQPNKSALDVMTKPVISIEHNATVKQAAELLTRCEINVLPVMKNASYSGIISREIVEKALFHGFKKSKVIEFTTTDALTTSPDTSIREIERKMIEQNQRFIAVLENNTLVGAITRTDLLRCVYEDYIRKHRVNLKINEAKSPFKRNIASLIKERFPSVIFKILLSAADLADKMQINAYLVGGSIRDLLRGQRNLDIDIVIEGDGINFALELAALIGGKVKTHQRFQTAKIIDIPILQENNNQQNNKTLNRSFTIDIATARTEYYEKPAELPKVQISSIKKDLYRRDFTINALAAKINRKDFGMLIDYYGGQKDLKEGVIRVLHNLSFIEDPTRAFRAIRFSERFSFRIGKHTEKLIKSALRFNLFERLSGSRLYDELMLIFKETQPQNALKRLSSYGFLQIIHPELTFTQSLEKLLNNLHDAVSWYNLSFLENALDKTILYLMALIDNLDEQGQELALNRLNTPNNIKTSVLKGLKASKLLMRSFDVKDPVHVYHRLNSLKLEPIVFLMAISPSDDIKKAVSKYLTELINIKPQLRGSDILKLGIKPGPIYSKILNEILDEKLKGIIKTKEQEFSYVKKHYTAAQ
ncbi:tRNA nucleotidyltransferase/poly(A) polymerase [Candidatus Magnetoovum chiemensis]|nr:tRNA nucleotidyltransferase/poly(A) polymerase [Candidatus Magnetoovum chiemensis]